MWQELHPYPHFEAPHRLALGLRAVAPHEDWIAMDGELASDLAEKERLLHDHHDQVSVALPDSARAQAEVRERIDRYLEERNPGAQRVGAGRGRPLEAAARAVQEDLCILQRGAEAWRLSAGVVCFPTRWDLPSRLGLPLADIHERVPGYPDELAAPADRFFDGMKPGRVFARSNWSLVDDYALFQPGGKLRTEHNSSIDSDHAGERVWIRTEGQTLQRLPETGAILFTIRVFRTPLAALERDPEAAAALARSLRSMSTAFLRYKSFPPIGEAVLGYLDRVCATVAPDE